jgi:3-hydroxybutyryl-CoA dehydrogenase
MSNTPLKGQVVILGTGTMAAGIAAGFIDAGIPVVMLGRDSAKAQACVEAARQLAAVLRTPSRTDTPARVGDIAHWADWSDVAWVIETITENFDLKRDLFADLDRRVPAHIPIGSNSSGFPVTKLAEGLATRRRMFNAHYFMPAHLVPLVEVALGEDSDPGLGQQVCDFYRAAGKKPVLVRRDIPGFLANRIQHALMREALDLIDRGIASPEDVDTAVRYSFGFRYAAAGPVLQKEISGWDSMAQASREIYPSLSNTDHLARCVSDLMAQGRTGMKAGAGFNTWTPEQIALERRHYDARLKAAFEILSMK